MDTLNIVIGKQAVISGGNDVDRLIINLAETHSHSHS